MTSYSYNTPLGTYTTGLSTIEEVVAQTRAIVNAFCTITGMEVKDTVIGSEETNKRHYITVGYPNDVPLIYFGCTCSACWNTRFEYGILGTAIQQDSSVVYEPLNWVSQESSSINYEYFYEYRNYNSNDNSYVMTYHYINGRTATVGINYVITNNGALCFTLLAGRNADALSVNSYILALPITDGTTTKHIVVDCWIDNNKTNYGLFPGGNENLAIYSTDYNNYHMLRAIMFPTFVTTAFAPYTSSSTMIASNFIKRGEGGMVTHRLYLPQSAAGDWYVPEGIIYEALMINQMPNVGVITQYGNKRLMCFSPANSGGLRVCINVDAM